MEPLTVNRFDPDDTTLDARPDGGRLDCTLIGTRGVNRTLQALPDGAAVQILQPWGRHNLAVGLARDIAVTVDGNAGYFLGGQCGRWDGGPDIVVDGFVGWSVGENLMGGSIRVRGSASQSAGQALGGDASSSRGMRHSGRASRSRGARWSSPVTPAP